MWCSSFLLTVCMPFKTLRIYSIIVFSLVYWFLISFRSPNVDVDYAQYISYIQDAVYYGLTTRGGFVFEWMAKTLYFFKLPLTLIFSIYAFSVILKSALFLKFSHYSHSIFIGYVGFFIYLHDFTQIRAGLAIAISYWAIYLKYGSPTNNNNLWILVALLGALIHPSLISIPLFIMVGNYISLRFLFFTLIVAIFLAASNTMQSTIDVAVVLIGNKDLNIYYELSKLQTIKPFGLFPILTLSITFLMYFYLPKYFEHDRQTIFFIKMLILSQIIWFSLYPIPVFAGRFSQIFLYSIVFTLPLLSKLFLKNYSILPSIYSLGGFIAFNSVGGLMHEFSFDF